MPCNINIGRTIREELHRQGRTVVWLSRQLGTSRMACYRIFECYSVDTQVLLRISFLLGRDFFELYSRSLKEDDLTDELCFDDGMAEPRSVGDGEALEPVVEEAEP